MRSRADGRRHLRHDLYGVIVGAEWPPLNKYGLRTQIWDSLPPRSMVIWSVAVLLRVRQERDVDCGPQTYRVATKASHFIQLSGRVSNAG